MFSTGRSTRTGGRFLPAGWLVLIVIVFGNATSLAQRAVEPQELAKLKRAYLEACATRPEGPPPMPTVARYLGVAPLAEGVTPGREPGAPDSVDLYVGLQPTPPGNAFWLWTIGGSEVVYRALDDGKMGPAAVAVGGGHVTEYEFSFGLHADVPNDTLRPYVIVSFYSAPPDPVADATDPVVEPPTPVSSIAFLFNPITLPSAGFYSVRSGLIDLAALNFDFDLDKTYYVEILPLEWSSWPAGAPIFDPDVFAIFTGPGTVTYGINQDHMWSDLWVLQGGCDPAVHLVNGNGNGFYNHPAEMYDGGCSPYLNQSGIKLLGDLCPGTPKLILSINEPDDVCVKPGEPVTVTLSMTCLPEPVRGFQAFLSFDTSALTFVSGQYTPEPFGLPIIDPIAAVGADIDLAAGINDPGGQTPTSTSADLVTLNFTAGTKEGLTQVVFRPHDPPTRFSGVPGNPLSVTPLNSPTFTVDGTPPVISCPADITRNADAGKCEASINPGTATATDNLDPNPAITWVRSDGKPNLTDPYEAIHSPITITWTATDCAGNVDTCDQIITVFAFNEVVVDIELDGTVAAGPFTRCVTFELWECGTPSSVTVDEVMTFTGGVASATVLVPCGDYECITARDKLHTLRRTAVNPDFQIVGTQYVADFAGAGKDLIGGNLNDDSWIDILDFGVYSWQYVANPTPGANTNCTTPFPHADIDGDGLVDAADFTFIQINFLAGHEANCCGQPGDMAGPITSITLDELKARGLGCLKVADLNNDGVLDQADMAAFLQGARPNKPSERPLKRSLRGARSSQRGQP